MAIHGLYMVKGIKVYFYGETTSPKGNVNYNGHQWIIYDINDKLGVKLAGDQKYWQMSQLMFSQ